MRGLTCVASSATPPMPQLPATMVAWSGLILPATSGRLEVRTIRESLDTSMICHARTDAHWFVLSRVMRRRGGAKRRKGEEEEEEEAAPG